MAQDHHSVVRLHCDRRHPGIPDAVQDRAIRKPPVDDPGGVRADDARSSVAPGEGDGHGAGNQHHHR
jgi:hypothetical protein